MSNANPASFDKPYLRDFFSEQRQALCAEPETKKALDREIQARLLISPEYRAASAVLLYMARPSEISATMILYAALANHKAVALPVCLPEHRMQFRRIRSLRDVAPGKFGILEPSIECEVLIPDSDTLCVCPALACDMRGYRLGFGGGYYDRFLKDFPGMKAALCYADSLIPMIHEEAFDVKMDVIHTDSFTRTMK